MIQFFDVLKRKGRGERGRYRFKLAVIKLEAADAETHRIRRGEVPAPAPCFGTQLAFLWHLQMYVVVRFIGVRLRGCDSEADIAIQFQHRQLCHLTHGRTALLYADKKVCILFCKDMRYEIIAFKTTVSYNQRLFLEVVTL